MLISMLTALYSQTTNGLTDPQTLSPRDQQPVIDPKAPTNPNDLGAYTRQQVTLKLDQVSQAKTMLATAQAASATTKEQITKLVQEKFDLKKKIDTVHDNLKESHKAFIEAKTFADKAFADIDTALQAAQRAARSTQEIASMQQIAGSYQGDKKAINTALGKLNQELAESEVLDEKLK